MAEYETRRFTRLEYEKLIDLGVFRQGEAIELLGGHLVVAEPQGARHYTAIVKTARVLQAAFGAGAYVRIQGPIGLDDESEPEPDVAVVPGAVDDYGDAHPARAVLVVEIAESSVAFDRDDKGAPMTPTYFAVRRRRGPAWNAAMTMREQAGWGAHASFMNALAAEGFVVLGGPLGDGTETLLIVDAMSEDSIVTRLASDPWTLTGLLEVVRIDPWTILLDRDAASAKHHALLTRTYEAFNARDIATALAAMHADVEWANGMEGGVVRGLDAVREYWTRQWRSIDPRVEPRRISSDGVGRVVVEAHQSYGISPGES